MSVEMFYEDSPKDVYELKYPIKTTRPTTMVWHLAIIRDEGQFCSKTKKLLNMRQTLFLRKPMLSSGKSRHASYDDGIKKESKRTITISR